VTALRGAWSVLLPRRQEGLSKMMAYSVFFHLFLFLSIVLNRTLFSSQKTSFDGFQVNLVASGDGGGITSGRASVPRVSKKSKNLSPKKSSKVRVKAPSVAKETSPKEPVVPKMAQAKAAPKALPALTRAPRRSVNAPPPETEDPERLQEWWKKQKKALKTPSKTPGIKPKMGVSERTRTAKIDIQKRPALVPPVVSPSKPTTKIEPQVTPTPDKTEPEKQSTPEAASNQRGASSHENNAEGAGAEEETSASQEGSLQASLGPGITGIGPGGAGASFMFPGYLQKVDHKIRNLWAPPPVASRRDRLVIRFVIQKNGGVDKSSVEITESSGNIFLDQAAIRAIPKLLPPLPKAYNEDVLIVFMNFVVREDS